MFAGLGPPGQGPASGPTWAAYVIARRGSPARQSGFLPYHITCWIKAPGAGKCRLVLCGCRSTLLAHPQPTRTEYKTFWLWDMELISRRRPAPVPEHRPADLQRRLAAEPGEPSFEGRIWFLHPGYPAPYHTLFSLPRVDPSPRDAGTLRGHYWIAILAAQTIVDNAFSSAYLSVDREGMKPVDDLVPSDGILTECEYYLVVAGYGT